MATKKGENKWLDALQKTGVVLAVLIPVCGVIIWYHERELSMKDGQIAMKDGQIAMKDGQIEHLDILRYDNALALIESLKVLYNRELDTLNQKIKKLEAKEGQYSEQIKIYKHQVIELQTKINFIKEISDDLIQAAEVKFGTKFIYTEIVSFSFYKFFDESNAYRDSLFENYDMLYRHQRMYDPQWGHPYMLSGQHSPIFYSFDSVDLRTATFRNADLRGVDLSNSIFDSKTKFPNAK